MTMETPITTGDPFDRRPAVLCTFYEDAATDHTESQKQGRTVFKTVTRVKMVKKGTNGETVDEPLKMVQGNQELWEFVRPQYEAWQSGRQHVSGTPLTAWPMATPAMVRVMENANLFSIEDLATLPDNLLPNIGMGARKWRNDAIAWLKASEDVGGAAAAIAERDDKIAHLEQQLASLRETVEGLAAKAE